MIHYAQYDKSPRLQRVAKFLADHPHVFHTTRDIVYGANVVAVNTIIDELRENGFIIESRRVVGGRGAWEYRMTHWRDGHQTNQERTGAVGSGE